MDSSRHTWERGGALSRDDTVVAQLGQARMASPLNLSTQPGDGLGDFVHAESRVKVQVDAGSNAPYQDLAFERAGPRERIYFDPSTVRAAVVTCGGLCPGLNNVIRSLTLELRLNYGVKDVLGIRNGYLGLTAASGLEPKSLTEAAVEEIHRAGGSVLGTSRGPQDSGEIAEFLVERGINMLFCVGGDGTQSGAHALAQELQRRQLDIAVVGIPKTIDNDIMYVYTSFGFATALDVAQHALRCAHTEARSVINGIGIVKLMGRNAGFITAGAALASQDANFVLIPEVPFEMDGPGGLLAALEARLSDRKHALIAVAEGAGQHLFDQSPGKRDASGHVQFNDIGQLLQDRIREYFAARKITVGLKYIDPSYLIRSVPACTTDCLLTDEMARSAVHAAMSGRTDMLIGLWNNRHVHVPIKTAIRDPRQLDLEGDQWTRVLLATGQPRWGVPLPS